MKSEVAPSPIPAGMSLASACPWPVFEQDEIDAVSGVLRSGKVNYWTGTEGREFEKEFASWAGSKYAIAATNGTVTIEMCLLALGLQPGDEVITTPRTFIASSSACVIHGLKPVYADVDLDSGNITAETIEKVITPKTKAILPVHLAGWPCDMPAIMDLANSKGISVIEDCAQAHGAKVGDRSVGTFGQVNSWSFCQDKIMTTGGEGGMITTDDADLWSMMWSYKDHGKSYDAVYNRTHPSGFRWLHESWGTNFRMTEVQSTIGRLQLKKLADWTALRTRNANILTSHLKGLSALRLPLPGDDMTHAYYKYYAYIRPEALKSDWSRDRIFEEMSALGIPALSGSCSEIYLEKAYDTTPGLRPVERLKNAQELGETSIMLLVHPTLGEAEMHWIGENVAQILNRAAR
jgi:dTDP-4-amino-4,6-dideoxygalactose transaminase